MFNSIIIMFKCTARIIRRINKYTLHLPRINRQQRLQRLQIIPLDNHIPGTQITIRMLVIRLQQPIRRLGGHLRDYFRWEAEKKKPLTALVVRDSPRGRLLLPGQAATSRTRDFPAAWRSGAKPRAVRHIRLTSPRNGCPDPSV